MRRPIFLAWVGLLIAGCAQEPVLQPSYLGVSDAAASEDDDGAAAKSASIEPVLARIPSNKVLGAMAFRKVTGRTIDPGRLTSSGR